MEVRRENTVYSLVVIMYRAKIAGKKQGAKDLFNLSPSHVLFTLVGDRILVSITAASVIQHHWLRVCNSYILTDVTQFSWTGKNSAGPAPVRSQALNP